MSAIASIPDAELPLVSVLIATHNYAEFLPRSIDSVLAQDYPSSRLEVIVVDDGSEDDTPAVVEPYLDRITYIRKPNGGLLSSVNRLFAEAHGDLLALQSGDDVFLPGRIALQVAQFLQRPELGLIYGDMRVIDAEDHTLADSYWATHGIRPIRGRGVARLMQGNVVSGGTTMIRGSLREQFHPIPEFAAWEDWWIALRIAAVAEIDYLDVPLLGYRRHGRNMNLGLEGARAIERYATELPIRRWIVTDLECEEATAPDWLEVYRHWSGILNMVAAGRGTAVEELVTVTDEGRAASQRAAFAAGEFLAAGELAPAARQVVRALGHDPFAEAGQRALAALGWAFEGGSPAPELAQARGFVTLADAEELIAAPELLVAYGSVFDGSAEASLVILVAGDRIDALSATVAQAGMAGDDAAEMIGIPISGAYEEAAERLARDVHAVLTRRAPQGELFVRPHVDDGAVAHLRQLAERRRAPVA